MQFLSGPPCRAATIFAQVVDNQTHIFEVSHFCLRVPEPKTFREARDQRRSALNKVRRRRSGRRQFVQFIGPVSHENNLRNAGQQGKDTLPVCRAWGASLHDCASAVNRKRR